MRALTDPDLLRIWERALRAAGAARAVRMLQAAEEGSTRSDVEELPVGVRDSRLLRLRCDLFGTSLVTIAQCPHCNERLELSFDASNLEVEALDVRTGRVEREGVCVTFRLPNSRDLDAISRCTSPGEARASLLERCLLEVEGESHCELPEAVIDEISRVMGEMDPGANRSVSLTCTSCATGLTLPFDVAAFLWNELHFRATETLRDVHTLACAYGWSERDILALTPERRQFYIAEVTR